MAGRDLVRTSPDGLMARAELVRRSADGLTTRPELVLDRVVNIAENVRDRERVRRIIAFRIDRLSFNARVAEDAERPQLAEWMQQRAAAYKWWLDGMDAA